ncbi:MAG: TIGR04086 family membrane protein [Bacillota bacterium]
MPVPRRRQEVPPPGLSMSAVGSGLVVGIIWMVIATAALLWPLLRTDYLDAQLPLVLRAIGLAGVLLGGIIAGRRARNRGWLHGALVGVLYAGVATLLGALLVSAPAAGAATVGWRFASAVLIGALGGTVGVNL